MIQSQSASESASFFMAKDGLAPPSPLHTSNISATVHLAVELIRFIARMHLQRIAVFK